MIILKLYFLIGFIYLLLSTFFGDIEHSITIHIIRLIVFVLIWPLLLYSIFFEIWKNSEIHETKNYLENIYARNR